MRPEPAAPSARRAVAAYRDQSAHDLRLELLGGDLDLAQFRVLDRARLELDWVALDPDDDEDLTPLAMTGVKHTARAAETLERSRDTPASG